MLPLLHLLQGNQFYKDGKYDKAIESYERAITFYGPKTVYMNNLAAAYMKVNR